MLCLLAVKPRALRLQAGVCGLYTAHRQHGRPVAGHAPEAAQEGADPCGAWQRQRHQHDILAGRGASAAR